MIQNSTLQHFQKKTTQNRNRKGYPTNLSFTGPETPKLHFRPLVQTQNLALGLKCHASIPHSAISHDGAPKSLLLQTFIQRKSRSMGHNQWKARLGCNFIQNSSHATGEMPPFDRRNGIDLVPFPTKIARL